MSKFHLYLERFWLIVASLLTIAVIVYLFQDGWNSTKYLFLIVGLAWGMFLFRRGVRKRMEKYAKQPPTKKKKK
ncbi:hypothetical protein [Parvicella tangerina]|uniref:Uncharacterized protein n=1 Tax=Parvicella tangerina TaxID=2829795 RepID=A0A916JQT6_9FLAO|nr:hypothetical protein [Parvicella tangerina]CAG5087864.1 hypothetical protein CRYO30217_03603 [Parvicella tangerina]